MSRRCACNARSPAPWAHYYLARQEACACCSHMPHSTIRACRPCNGRTRGREGRRCGRLADQSAGAAPGGCLAARDRTPIVEPQRLDGRGIGVGRRMSETAFLVLRPWLTHRLVEGLAVLQQRIDLARLPWSQKFSAAQALGQGVPDPARDPAGSESQSVGLTTPFPSLTTQGVPPFVRTVVAGGEQLALNRVMLAVLAVERYRRAHHETLPPSLDATVSDYLDRVPTDPFDGAPLRFTRTADSYAIYSIGPDARDDGGDTGEWVSDIRPAGPNAPAPRDRGIRVPLHPIQ